MPSSLEKEAKKPTVIALLKDTYSAVINNAVGCHMFRNSYALVDGVKKDILEDGTLSCAFFVSSVLVWSALIKEVHATVRSTVKDLLDSGWESIPEPRVGAVLVWEACDFGVEYGVHKHIGFYIGDEKAISHSDTEKQPVVHSFNFNGERNIEQILWNKKLD